MPEPRGVPAPFGDRVSQSVNYLDRGDLAGMRPFLYKLRGSPVVASFSLGSRALLSQEGFGLATECAQASCGLGRTSVFPLDDGSTHMPCFRPRLRSRPITKVMGGVEEQFRLRLHRNLRQNEILTRLQVRVRMGTRQSYITPSGPESVRPMTESIPDGEPDELHLRFLGGERQASGRHEASQAVDHGPAKIGVVHGGSSAH